MSAATKIHDHVNKIKEKYGNKENIVNKAQNKHPKQVQNRN